MNDGRATRLERCAMGEEEEHGLGVLFDILQSAVWDQPNRTRMSGVCLGKPPDMRRPLP